jgi:cell wall-associated NlpC family hydrolase
MKIQEISKVDLPFKIFVKGIYDCVEMRFYQLTKILDFAAIRYRGGGRGIFHLSRQVCFLFISISIFSGACSPRASQHQRGRSTTDHHNLDLASRVVTLAKQYEGANYKYGGQGPKSFDCSGFTQFVYSKAGVSIPRRSKDQARTGKKISIRHAKKGDLIILTKGRKVQHVGIVSAAKNGDLFVTHASTSKGVITENMSSSSYWKSRLRFARRVLP